MQTEQLKEALSIGAPYVPIDTAPGTVLAGPLDMQKFNRGMFILQLGAFAGASTVAFKLTESDTSGGSYTDVSGGGGTTLAVAGKCATIEFRASQISKRFVKLSITVGVANAVVCCIPIGAQAEHKPATVNDSAIVVQRTVV